MPDQALDTRILKEADRPCASAAQLNGIALSVAVGRWNPSDGHCGRRSSRKEESVGRSIGTWARSITVQGR